MANWNLDEDDEEEKRDRDEPFSIPGATILKARPTAVLVQAPRFNDSVWIPSSVVHDDSEVYDAGPNAGPGKLVLKYWWAVKKGWV